ncbi:MAG: hypothetical protein RL254_1761 [Planctomycetota bacterium]|jgi:transcription termination factor Rho|nr:MAG: transcription termination factor Rho [Planctomycetota bacterium]RLS51918.1 MAG: transcription termination factor Rho [Planctomycetota bacterium]
MTVVSGILEAMKGSSEGRIRQFSDGLVEREDDPVVLPDFMQRNGVAPGAAITVEVEERQSRRTHRMHMVASKLVAIEGMTPEDYRKRKNFSELTALDPQPRISLEHRGCPPACRLIDMFCPIGFGTRGLIVAPPKAGKTILLQNIAFGIKHNHPEIELIALLIDERPEEVTDFRRNVPAHVLASSNDEDLDRHLALGQFAIERAKRMVEAGRDVVVLLDSLTRLGRAFNNSRRYGSSGRTMSGGVDSRALEVPKQLFGAARKCEEGGSLTIIATCLVDTGSRADQVIFEEFKGTGNMELILDRTIAERRIFPAINLAQSGTRKEHLLMPERELKTITALRRRLLNAPPHVQMEQLLGALNRFPANEDMLKG